MVTTNNQNRIGLVNRRGFSIHHIASSARFSQAAFIFNEPRPAWLIVGLSGTRRASPQVPGVNPMLNRVCLKLDE
jgi:hypothetical protein